MSSLTVKKETPARSWRYNKHRNWLKLLAKFKENYKILNLPGAQHSVFACDSSAARVESCQHFQMFMLLDETNLAPY